MSRVKYLPSPLQPLIGVCLIASAAPKMQGRPEGEGRRNNLSMGPEILGPPFEPSFARAYHAGLTKSAQLRITTVQIVLLLLTAGDVY